MINVSISYGFGPDNRYKLKNIPVAIQLALYKYELWEKYADDIVNEIYQNNVKVNAIHLPLDTMRQPVHKILDMMKILSSTILCEKFIFHPNKGAEFFIQSFLSSGMNAILCIENFPHRKKKALRNPLYIIERCMQDNTHRLKLCFDTSHAEETWFHPHILPYILKYTSVIHLSNRKGKSQHLPFNMQNADLNLVGFVKELKRRFQWKGDIVLEYMPQYHHKLHRNCDYLTRLIT